MEIHSKKGNLYHGICRGWHVLSDSGWNATVDCQIHRNLARIVRVSRTQQGLMQELQAEGTLKVDRKVIAVRQ
jgi:hypothetical protein